MSTTGRLRLVSIAVAGGVLASLAALPTLAGAATPTVAPPALRLDGGLYELTLITGDQVTLRAAGDGRYSVSVAHAARSDGSTPAVEVVDRGDGLYAFPDDARPLIDAGRLDEELFHVEYLAAQGYGTGGRLPVIVQYADAYPVGGGAAARSGATPADPPGSTRTATLASINALGLDLDPAGATGFWASLATSGRDPAARSAVVPGGIERIWLDRPVEVALDESVPQIGAPTAWDAGLDGTGTKVCVVDTGIDADHPDLAGKVVASQSFVPGEPVADGHGHGTHVAATVAGTGAASGGRYPGVAPGAELAIAKGLDNTGGGSFAQIIDAMEWCALDQGADVVSLSLSADPTDGTDPASRAVDELTAATGALFVIAASNDGPGAFTVGAPGAASAALTVGAVDGSDALADFSSRGPRVGDFAVKPEITAPGVGITAARAAGTSLGTPVDDDYTTLNGTSMATPHVAGAAAILAQQHPDWGAPTLKAALVASAADGGYTVYEQGAGRVDLARAITQAATSAPATVDFGFFPWPQQGAPVTSTITYANPTGEPVTLDLAAAATVDGTPATAGVLSLSAGTVTVPAGGTAGVTVTLDQVAAESGLYSGMVVATGAGGIRLTTPVGFLVQEEKLPLRIRMAYTDEQVEFGGDSVQVSVVGIDGTDDTVYSAPVNPESPTAEVHVAAGTYTVQTRIWWTDPTTGLRQTALLVDPEVTVPDQAEVVLDGTAARRVAVDTPKPSESYDAQYAYERWAGDRWFGTMSFVAYGYQNFWVTPTGRVGRGGLRYTAQSVRGAPLVTMAVADRHPVQLHPISAHYREDVGLARFSGRSTLSVVDGGTGSAAELDRLDAHGKLVLLVQPANINHCQPVQETIDRVVAAGAAGILIRPAPACTIVSGLLNRTAPVPLVAIPTGDAELLRDRLEGGRGVRIRVDGTPRTPYVYRVALPQTGRIGDSLHYDLSSRDLAVIDHRFHATQPHVQTLEVAAWQPDQSLVPASLFEGMPAPRGLTEYYAPLGPDAVVKHAVDSGMTGYQQRFDVFARPRSVAIGWNDSPAVPSVPSLTAAQRAQPDRFYHVCTGCREGNTFYPFIHYSASADPYQASIFDGLTPFAGFYGDPDLHLYDQAGAEIVAAPGPPSLPAFASYELPGEPGRYRLTHGAGGGRVATAWEFTSRPVREDQSIDGYRCVEAAVGDSEQPCRAEPLIFPRYDLGLGLDNTTPASGTHWIRITAERQPAAGRPPAIAGVDVRVSLDRGATWRRVPDIDLGRGRYAAAVNYWWIGGRTGDAVSLRVTARDTAGNRVEQTVLDAFMLGGRH
jgi:subtilisin family serine protease